MKTIFLGIAAGVAFAAVAQADQFTDSIVSDLQGQGYGYIEVKQGPTQVKVEAVRGGTKIEVVYDRSTGKILKQESGAAGDDYTGRSGVEISTRNRSFVDASDSGRGSDDDDDDDRGDHDSDRDRDGDDHRSDDSGSRGDDDSSRGGDDDSGGDDSGGDDDGDRGSDDD